MNDTNQICVNYEMFGAKGDGVTDDMEAIRAAHNYANEHNMQVKTNPFATYYIGPAPMNVLIMTSVDFGTSKFIIDDTNVKFEDRNASIFKVVSRHAPIKIENVSSIKKNQMKLELSEELPRNCYCRVDNANKKQFIRFGNNQNSGSSQRDSFVIDKTGYILNKVIWDFDSVTSCVAYPIDEEILTVRGGIFTHIANQSESILKYYSRNIVVTRSNTVLENITMFVEGELDHGAPYGGFIDISICAYVTVQNCHLTARKTFWGTGSAGVPVPMGTYAFGANDVVNLTLKNVKQNGIMDRTRWGLMGTNHCKDVYIDGCTMSRFDAHENVANLTIKNTVLGHQCFNAIGCGVMTVENVIAYGASFLGLRGDYGSNWNGDVIFKNNTWYPNIGVKAPCFIGSMNAGNHDFGYDCYQTRNILIDKLYICDGDAADGYTGSSLFTISNSNNSGEVDYNDITVAHPYVCPAKIYLKDIKTESGKGFKLFSADTKNCFAENKHNVKDDSFVPNMRVYLEDVEMPEASIVPATSLNAEDYGSNHHVVPRIEIKSCENVVICTTNTPALIKLTDSTVKTLESCDSVKIIED